MAKVILGTTMSLDGFINDPNGSVAALYPDLETWRYTEPGRESIQNTGAAGMGRNSFAIAKDPDSLAEDYNTRFRFSFSPTGLQRNNQKKIAA
jgi:hypothetical protein